MGITWQILSPLSLEDMIAVEEECLDLIDAFLKGHPHCSEQYGEVSAGGPLISEEDAVEAYRDSDTPLPKSTLKLLNDCQSGLFIERPGTLEVAALQVSILDYLLTRIGQALILFNDFPLKTTEEVQSDIKELPRSREFDRLWQGGEDVDSEEASEKGSDEVQRSTQLLDRLESALGNPMMAIDLKHAMIKGSEAMRCYAACLLQKGAMGLWRAAELLEIDRDTAEAASNELDKVLTSLLE